MEGKYELHLTFDHEVPVILGWKQTGWIKGDTDHEGEDRFYLTSYAPDEGRAREKVSHALHIYSMEAQRPIRAKIEHIIYDERF